MLVDLLGGVLIVPVTDSLFVANLFCLSDRGPQKILEYSALNICLNELCANGYYKAVLKSGRPSYVPYKMGSGANSADWTIVSDMVARSVENSVVCIIPNSNKK